MKNNYCIIMAGGVGSRFWPMSTPSKPKQFLDILGTGKTLIQMTYERLLSIAPKENIYILTNKSYADVVQEQLPDLKANQILQEPMRKNTAPCIAYAAAKIYQMNPEANLIISPSDHLILQQDKFQNIIHKAIENAQTNERIVTIAIKPTRPDTGYGYIEFDPHIKKQAGEITPIIQFREKPNLEIAELFLLKGNFYWNSGIFVWKASTILNALKEFQPELHQLFTENIEKYNTEDEQKMVDDCFQQCEDISIDFAVMEHTQNADVILSDFDWSDLGTWGSLVEHLKHDQNLNSIIGENAHLFNCSNCVVNVPKDKLVVVDGITDSIIVESDGMLLILKKENEQEIKNFLKEVETKSPNYFTK